MLVLTLTHKSIVKLLLLICNCELLTDIIRDAVLAKLYEPFVTVVIEPPDKLIVLLLLSAGVVYTGTLLLLPPVLQTLCVVLPSSGPKSSTVPSLK